MFSRTVRPWAMDSAEPVARHEGDAIGDCRARPGDVGLPPDRRIAPARGRSADERSPNALLACTAEPHEGYDLALVDIEASPGRHRP